MITWTSEPKSVEIRRASHQALTAMFATHTPQVNTTLQLVCYSAIPCLDSILQPTLPSALHCIVQMTGLVGRLPQLYQDQAAQLLDRPQPGQPDLGPSPGKLGRNNGAGQPAARARPRYCTAAALHHTTLACSPGRARLGEDSDNLNTDEVNKSLRLTANAIQNYSFDKVGHCSVGEPVQLTVQSTQCTAGGQTFRHLVAELRPGRREGQWYLPGVGGRGGAGGEVGAAGAGGAAQ